MDDKMSVEKTGGMPFIVSTSVDKADRDSRKLIRSHVMLGKNRRKPRQPKQGEESSHLPPFSVDRVPIPRKAGSDLALIQFADNLDLSTVAEVLQVSSAAKTTLFPLERCVFFDKKDKTLSDPLRSDPVYLHAFVFSSQTFVDLAMGRAPRPKILFHFLKTLRLLRERLFLEDDYAKVSDPTILAVRILAIHAWMTGDQQAAANHMQGLRKIVSLRGGITAFRHKTKIWGELMRHDICMALYRGEIPHFFRNQFAEPLLPYPIQLLPPQPSNCLPKEILKVINCELATSWRVMKSFSLQINLAAEKGRKVSEKFLVETMASVMYRLLHLGFEAGSLNEAVRLGILAFCSHIFIQWPDVRLSYFRLPLAYQKCLTALFYDNNVSTRNLLLWLLAVGAVSEISNAGETSWLKPLFRLHIEKCKVRLWDEMRAILKSFLWIDILHDRPGEVIFDSILHCALLPSINSHHSTKKSNQGKEPSVSE